jgi:hypothetical protein
MRIPSRKMPKAPERTLTAIGYIILSLIMAGFIALFWYAEPKLLIVGLLFVCFFIPIKWYEVHLDRRKLAEERKNESICTFARSFNCRIIDTWAIRAVYEELLPLNLNSPLRKSDRFEEDLHIDDEELDYMAPDIAYRACRSLENTKNNPLYGKVKTVGDLVLFLNNQPSTNTE